MQTFLPWRDFQKSAEALDTKRLGKQRLEAWTIYQALQRHSRGWKNHPATLMWRGFEKALLHYGLVVCEVWLGRGYNDSMKIRFDGELQFHKNMKLLYPPWFGLDEFHLSHRSNLIRKFPEYYRQQFGDIPDDLPYYWPGSIH